MNPDDARVAKIQETEQNKCGYQQGKNDVEGEQEISRDENREHFCDCQCVADIQRANEIAGLLFKTVTAVWAGILHDRRFQHENVAVVVENVSLVTFWTFSLNNTFECGHDVGVNMYNKGRTSVSFRPVQKTPIIALSGHF